MSAQFNYEIGQLVEHQRYGYRGVVVSRDSSCQASSGWYESNLTQPTREQPWYHVLVHGGDHSTYVAEENLLEDAGGEQVVHPLVATFFLYFTGGRYTPREGAAFPDSAF